jgi:AcrR family transcriptional regulator
VTRPEGDADCPRPARAESRILEATLDELAAEGFAGVTVEGVAARACVGRATIYRHWSSRADLVIAAVRSLHLGVAPPDTGRIRDDLVAQVTALAQNLAGSRLGTILPALIEGGRRDTEMAALYAALVDERRASFTPMVQRAVTRGELPRGVDGDLLLDLVVGPVFYRHLVRRTATEAAEVSLIVDAALAGVRR